MNILQPKLQAIMCGNVRLIYYPGTPILNPFQIQKKTIVRWNHRSLYMYSIKQKDVPQATKPYVHLQINQLKLQVQKEEKKEEMKEEKEA